MTISRREFVALAAGSVAISPLGWVRGSTGGARSPALKFRAAVFDAFPVFDPRPVFRLADEMFPGTGLSDEWRTRLWAAKEAAGKAAGTGMQGDPRKLVLTEVDGERMRIGERWIATRRDGDFAIAWTI